MASKQEKIAAAIGVGAVSLGLGVGGYLAGRRGATEAEVQAALTRTPIVGTPTPEWTPTTEPISALTTQVMRLASAERVIEKNGVEFGLGGVPERIDPGHKVLTVEVANTDFGGSYQNTLDEGTEAWLAEPGVLLGKYIPQSEVERTAGAVGQIDPTNQELFENPSGSFNVPEGGFTVASFGHGTVEVEEATFDLRGKPSHMWLLVVRGLFAGEDDRNRQAQFSNLAPGFAQAMRYPQGAFISEGNFAQLVRSGFSGDPNCGSTGCSEVSALFYDLNTKATTVVRLLSTEGGIKASSLWDNWR